LPVPVPLAGAGAGAAVDAALDRVRAMLWRLTH